MPSIVALDIETTGLDPAKDAIIEIGAVRFNGHRVEAEWSTLINPHRPISPFITQLTGISNEMVRNAPTLSSVLQDLVDFVGECPVLGHNVRFDLSFLQRSNILRYNDVLDTYELAAVLLPTASRYNLGALGQAMGILLPATHRALDDARVTHRLFLQLYDRALALPVDLIAEFLRLSEGFEWGASWIFSQILRARSRQPIAPRRVPAFARGPILERLPEEPVSAELPQTGPTMLDPDEVSAILEHGGLFSHYFQSYEYRPQQVEMLRSVVKAFNQGSHLLVEAGTGTGKSFAYLVPAALWAAHNNTRVIISTNTINLQDQLIKKDIPDLCAALNLDLRAVVVKGRSNYLCPRRLENLRNRGPETPEEMRVLAKVLVWLQESSSGDRSEINLNGPVERDIWMHISAEDEACKAETCMSRAHGTCPFYRIRQDAQNAHLIIVNHALLLSDVATGSRVLPEYNYLIVDEGHHLEAATTSALGFRVTQGDLVRLLRELGGSSSGILGHLMTDLKPLLKPSDFAAAQSQISRATDLSFRLEQLLRQFFESINDFLVEQREGRPMGTYAQQERITSATRTQPAWNGVEIAWDAVRETLVLLLNLLAEFYKTVGEFSDMDESVEDSQGNLANVYRRLFEADGHLARLVSNPDASMIYWIEQQPNGNNLVLQVAPLHTGPLMEKHLWHEKASVVLTSATLTTNDEFDYLRSRLNADEADELMVGSPFDYESSALLYMVKDIPEPSDANNYQRAIEQTIVRLAKATHGRMLALFTNYAQLKRTSQNISGPLTEAGIMVYEQGEGASANTLLETFRDSEKAVLLGTRAFWEGVDIPGEALSVLVIAKLPFDVPTDPIVAARSETFDDPFNE